MPSGCLADRSAGAAASGSQPVEVSAETHRGAPTEAARTYRLRGIVVDAANPHNDVIQVEFSEPIVPELSRVGDVRSAHHIGQVRRVGSEEPHLGEQRLRLLSTCPMPNSGRHFRSTTMESLA